MRFCSLRSRAQRSTLRISARAIGRAFYATPASDRVRYVSAAIRLHGSFWSAVTWEHRRRSPISLGTRRLRWSFEFMADGCSARRAPRWPRSSARSLSPTHHPNPAGKRRQGVASKRTDRNLLLWESTPQTIGGSEGFSRSGAATSQAGRRRFDPGRPLHQAYASIAQSDLPCWRSPIVGCVWALVRVESTPGQRVRICKGKPARGEERGAQPAAQAITPVPVTHSCTGS